MRRALAFYRLRGIQLLQEYRRLGFIVPQTWQTGDNYIPFRQNFVNGRFGPQRVVNLPFDVFPDAYVDTCIAIFEKPAPTACLTYCYPKKADVKELRLTEKDFERLATEQLASDAQLRLVTSLTA